MQRNAPMRGEGDEGYLLCSAGSSPSVLVLRGLIPSTSSRFIPGFVIKMRDAAAWPKSSVSTAVEGHGFPCSALWGWFLCPVSSPGDRRAVYIGWIFNFLVKIIKLNLFLRGCSSLCRRAGLSVHLASSLFKLLSAISLNTTCAS